MGSPGGFAVHPALFRVPDLLTYEQLQAYFRDTFGYHIELFPLDVDGNPVRDSEGPDTTPARALGQSFNIAPAIQLDDRTAEGEGFDVDRVRNLMSGVDPVLRDYNEKSMPAAYDTNPIGSNPASDDPRVSQVVDKDETMTNEEVEDSAVVDDDDSTSSGSEDGDSTVYTKD